MPELPKRIGPYKIEALLSKGGMSYLYLGVDSKKGIPLAIKVLSPKYLTHPEFVYQFLKEAEIIGLTDHPNIIKLYGQGEWANGLYIAMEFIQGISLKQFILKQNFSPTISTRAFSNFSPSVLKVCATRRSPSVQFSVVS